MLLSTNVQPDAEIRKPFTYAKRNEEMNAEFLTSEYPLEPDKTVFVKRGISLNPIKLQGRKYAVHSIRAGVQPCSLTSFDYSKHKMISTPASPSSVDQAVHQLRSKNLSAFLGSFSSKPFIIRKLKVIKRRSQYA